MFSYCWARTGMRPSSPIRQFALLGQRLGGNIPLIRQPGLDHHAGARRPWHLERGVRFFPAARPASMSGDDALACLETDPGPP